MMLSPEDSRLRATITDNFWTRLSTIIDLSFRTRLSPTDLVVPTENFNEQRSWPERITYENFALLCK
jgi:hypothetical protein